MHTRLQRQRKSGFTLMEILIVVTILGILAAIVIPSFASATNDTRKAAFVGDLRTFENAIRLYYNDNSDWPVDGGSGTVPAGLEPYIKVHKWEDGTPIGGVWDNETNDILTVGVGVHFDGSGETRDTDFMTLIDNTVDNGDITSGSFRQYGDRYYRVIRE